MFGFGWFFGQLAKLIVTGLSYVLLGLFGQSDSQDADLICLEFKQSAESLCGVTLQQLLFADEDQIVRTKRGGGDSVESTAQKQSKEEELSAESKWSLSAKTQLHEFLKCYEIQSPATLPATVADPSDLRKNSRCKIYLSHCDSTFVRLAAKSHSMKNTPVNWDLCWTTNFASIQKCKLMKNHQRINHFPGSFHFSRKDHLAKNLNWMQKHFPEEYDFFPKTWVLPEEVEHFSAYARKHPGAYFIHKPNNGCSGKGITLSRFSPRMALSHKMTTQVYIENPFLIDEFKFDFRLYVLLSSIDPLKIFVYEEGFARFATVKYKQPTDKNASNKFMHLTNTSVNIQSEGYVRDEFWGNYRKMSTVLNWLNGNGYDIDDVKRSIDDVVIKTILSCLPTLRCYYAQSFPSDVSSACFELFGFDIIFDRNLKPYLLEVNCSPSLQWGTGTLYEKEVKKSVVFDIFDLLNLSKRGRYLKKNRTMNHRQNNWEDSHAGNFRKIYPPPRKLSKYYRKFFNKGTRNPYVYIYP